MWPLAVLTGDKSSLAGDVWPFRSSFYCKRKTPSSM